jgi:type I restriction enzyme S subunit
MQRSTGSSGRSAIFWELRRKVSKMMTGEELKASILQMAMQGKLVEQRPEEGTGEELYQEIQKEKQRLVKEGKIKKGKKVAPISDDEIPFEIPENWEWVRIGDVFQLTMGQSPKGEFVFEGNEGIEFHQGKIYFSKKYLQKSPQCTTKPSRVVKENTVLLCVRAPVGTVNITTRKICIGRGLCGVNGLSGVSPEFIFFWLDGIKNDFQKKATGTTFVAITGKVVERELIPLPPLEEQKRIVAKIEELMPFVDQYAASSEKLNTLNVTFPDQMKKSILQEAVQGKLVPQDPSDEPASVLLEKIAEEKKKLIKEGKIKKQKKLPPITEDEIPFDIPESWEWARLTDCLDVRDGTHDSPKYHSEGYPLVTSKNLKGEGIDFSNCKLISEEDYESINQRSKVDNGDILFAMIGTVGNPVLYHGDANFSIKNMALFKHVGNLLNMEYVYWFLLYAQYDMKKKASGGVQNFVSLSFLRKYLIPVPPIKEQDRIVLKLNEMRNVIGKLGKSMK